tara:strand:+ start:6150 stop:6992 length:843 start_codon:yes stop_codon:yes gene_type:complete
MQQIVPVSLALGGGGARGLAHIVVLEALDDLGIQPVEIAGTSIGAIIGAGYAGGLSGRQIRDAALALFSKRSKTAQLFWQMRGKRVLPRLSFTDFDPSVVLETFVGGLIPAKFEDLQIPLTVVATDFYGWSERVFQSGDLHQAVAASFAIPVLFSPVRVDGRILVDGGFVNPLPFDHLCRDNMCIAVDVTGGPKAPAVEEDGQQAPMPAMREMIFGVTQLLMQSIASEKLKSRRPDILFRPQIEEFGVLEFMKAKDILQAAERDRDIIKRSITDKLESMR